MHVLVEAEAGQRLVLGVAPAGAALVPDAAHNLGVAVADGMCALVRMVIFDQSKFS